LPQVGSHKFEGRRRQDLCCPPACALHVARHAPAAACGDGGSLPRPRRLVPVIRLRGVTGRRQVKLIHAHRLGDRWAVLISRLPRRRWAPQCVRLSQG
jgi:hypothetical protein